MFGLSNRCRKNLSEPVPVSALPVCLCNDGEMANGPDLNSNELAVSRYAAPVNAVLLLATDT